MEIEFVTVSEFKKYVPALSVGTIRRLCKKGALVCVWSGNRPKINLHASLEALAGYKEGRGMKPEPSPEPPDESKIPPILRRNPKFPGRPPDSVRLAKKEAAEKMLNE
jgi:hypothetical protein